MPPKNKRQDDGEEPFQAVILTDSYDARFLPVSHEMPRCLMPLCNLPLIEYTLEILALINVQDVFVVSSSHIDKIKDYFEHSNWLKPHNPLNVQIIQAPEAMSVGDALRELDSRQLITTDFLLTFGDLVSNIKLDKILEAHRARRKTDKNSIMTMVLKEATRTHSSRPKDESGVFVLDPDNSQCLFYEPVEEFPRKGPIEISPELLENHTQFELRNDLVDPFLDICSVEVPALFTENFDWQRLRRDFVHGVLTSDILGKTIYTEIVSEPYIARIQNEQLYESVSKHMLNRWTFPIVPETNLNHLDDYQYIRGNIYKASDVILSRSCIIDENVQIGAGTVIGENTRIANTIIGRNCNIGDNVVLENAYVWDNVSIFANSTVSQAILANNVTLMENTTVENGCIISVGVTVGPNESIPKYSRLSLLPQPKTSMFADDSDEEEDMAEQNKVLSNSKHPDVYFWTESTDDDDDVDIRNIKLGSLAFKMADLTIKDDELSDSASEVGEESDSDSDIENGNISINAAWGTHDAHSTAEFRKEIAQTLERSIHENHSVEEAAIEITSLRMSHNGSYDLVREVMIPLLLDSVDVSKNPANNIRTMLNKWSALIIKATHGREDQVHVLRVFQKHCAKNDQLNKLFLGILQLLYDLDVVEEESILKWYTSDASKSGSPAELSLRDKATKFINWLQEAEEESSEEEDSDDE